MNGPVRMYRMKQIVKHDFPVELPRCMYPLKNIHSKWKCANGIVDGNADHVAASNKKLDIFDQVKQFLKNNHQTQGMAELEAKQEKILLQLADLKRQILSIKESICPKTQLASEKTIEDLQDIIINASPTNPPYSLEILQKLLQDRISLVFTTHVHSTVSSLTEDARKLEQNLINFSPKSNVPVLNVRLIWKNVDTNLELLVTPTSILGEVNLLRYLVRVAKSPLNYEYDQDSFEIDSLLDIVYLIVKSKTKTEKSALLQCLNKSLGKSQWLAGRSRVSIADIAAYSAIRQCSSINDISANLSKWFQRCETVV